MNKELSTFTNEELMKELARRWIIDKYDDKPKPLLIPNFTNLIMACTKAIDDLSEEGLEIDDFEISEEALEAVFGPKIHDWIDKQPE